MNLQDKKSDEQMLFVAILFVVLFFAAICLITARASAKKKIALVAAKAKSKWIKAIIITLVFVALSIASYLCYLHYKNKKPVEPVDDKKKDLVVEPTDL